GSSSATSQPTRPSRKPRPIPNAAPMAKDRNASVSVTERCSQMLPVTSHCHTRVATSLGRLKNNLSKKPALTSACQAPSRAAPSSPCHATTGATRLLPVALITLKHLLAQVGPNGPVQLAEARLCFYIEQMARP